MTNHASNEDGFVLVTALTLLLVLTVIGFTAMGTSRFENMIAGNMRTREQNLLTAEAGLAFSAPVLRIALAPVPEDIPLHSEVGVDSGLADEMVEPFANDTSDITFKIRKKEISTDIDFMAMRSSGNAEFGAENTVYIEYYRVNSEAENPAGTESVHGGIFRYVRQ